jgi:lipoic acid synthetase
MIPEDTLNPLPKAKSRLNILPQNPEKDDASKAVGLGRFPSWLHRKLPQGNELWQTSQVISQNRLHTVCEEAKCPNLLECWSKKTATFLIMGKACTRSCGFCDIDFTKKPLSLDENEPFRVAESVLQLGLKHVVITMVARDDLPDGGAAHMVNVIKEIREKSPSSTIEVLISDLCGNEKALKEILLAQPEIFNHNVETVREFTPFVRHKATYDRSLQVLKFASLHKPLNMLIKSGIMVGLGESPAQVEQTLKDLYEAGCDIVTIGQYLQANRHKLRVKAFVHPDQFKSYEEYGYALGFKHMYCGPFVRSSYHAEESLKLTKNSL